MTTEARLSMPLGEAMFSQRAIRRLKPDPIPEADLKAIMEATIRAPNGGNQQPWHFIVVQNPDLRRGLGCCTGKLGGPSGATKAFTALRISRRRTAHRNPL